MIGTEIVGHQLSNIYGEDLIGTGGWFNGWCVPHEKEFPSDYYIVVERDVPQGTEIVVTVTDISSGESINYHTIVETPLMTLFDETDSDTLFHYFARCINIIAEVSESYYVNNPYCWGCGGALPSSVKFNLEVVQGQEYGSLFDSETETSSTSFSNAEPYSGSGYLFECRFKFIADGIQPDSSEPGMVTIRCTPNDAAINTIEFSFPVAFNKYMPDERIIVEFTKPVLEAGETIQIILTKVNPNGTLENFPYDQKFEIGMMEGCELGFITAQGNTGPHFNNVMQPLYFTADSSAVSGEINIRAGIVEGGSSSKSVNGNGQEEVEGVVKKQKNILSANANTKELKKRL